MSWLSDLLHPERGYQSAQDKLQQYYNQANSMTQPFVNFGLGAGTDLTTIMQKLMNPGALQDEWSKGYKESDYAKQLEGEAQTAGLDAASSMGLGGSSAALSNIQKDKSNIVNADRQKYMDDLMQKYLASIGIGENLFGTGANTATNMANNAMTQGSNEAGLEYGKKTAKGNMLGNILGKVGGLGVSYLTGGLGSGAFGRGAFQPDWMRTK